MRARLPRTAVVPNRRCLLRSAVVAPGAALVAACGPLRQPSTQSRAALTGRLEFWQWGVSYEVGFAKLADAFNARTQGVTVVPSRPDGYDDKIKVTTAAGSGGPDVYMMRGPNVKQYAHDGLAIDLGSLVSKDRRASGDFGTFQKAFYDWYHYQGKLVGVPWDFSTISVAYNVRMMEAAGLKPPAELGDGWSWATLAEYARRLTRLDASPPRYGADAASGIETGWYNWVTANGGDYWSADFKQCLIASPQAIEAAEAYLDVPARQGTAAPRAWVTEQTRGLPHRANVLTNGLVAMQTAGDWFFGWYDRAADFKWDVAPVPLSPRTRKTGSIANFRGMVIAPTATNRELAWSWITYLATREVQDQVPALMGELPARIDSIEQVYLNPQKSPSPPHRRLLKASVEATRPLPGHPTIAWSNVSGTTNGPLNNAYDGKRPVREAMMEVQSQLQAMLRG